MLNPSLIRLIRLLEELKSYKSTQKEDIDEILILSEQLADVLHERFGSVARALENDFDQLGDNSVREAMSRLLRIAILANNISAASSNSAMNPEFVLEKDESERVHLLCTQMRKIIFASTIFDEPHKRRLLNRIAAIEYEIHQDKGKLDVILAGVVDIGDALGKFGDKVEPLTKRMKEIAGIVRSKSKEYDQIPAPDETLSLPAPKEE